MSTQVTRPRAMIQKNRLSGEGGFSITELLIAMTLTLMVSASIYGLMFAGQKSFRREPERTELQQNIRLAMDVMMADIATAGVGMPAFVQTFGLGLDGGGTNPDALEIYGNDGSCPDVPFAASNALAQALPGCYGTTTVPIFFHWANGGAPTAVNGTNGGPYWIVGNFTGSDPANANATGKTVTAVRSAPGFLVTGATGISRMNFVRYEIAPASATDAMPCLWRSDRGGTNVAGAYVSAAAAVAAGTEANSGWEMLARGIEDLQVQYQNELAGWTADGNAPTVVAAPAAPPDPRTIITAVRVTLSARSEGRRNIELQAGGIPYRTRLTWVGVPRASIFAKQAQFTGVRFPADPQGSWR